MSRLANRFPPNVLQDATDAGKAILTAADAAAQLALLMAGGAEAPGIKAVYLSAAIAVAVPSITDPDCAKVDVDVSAMTFAPAVGDAVIAIPQVALPTNARLSGAWVSATDTVQITFSSEGGNVVGANKNFKFLFVDLT